MPNDANMCLTFSLYYKVHNDKIYSPRYHVFCLTDMTLIYVLFPVFNIDGEAYEKSSFGIFIKNGEKGIFLPKKQNEKFQFKVHFTFDL